MYRPGYLMPAKEQLRGQRHGGIDMAGEGRHDDQHLRHQLPLTPVTTRPFETNSAMLPTRRAIKSSDDFLESQPIGSICSPKCCCKPPPLGTNFTLSGAR